MSTVCYFELPVDDMPRAQQFYKDLFQWKFDKMPGSPAEVDYWTITLGAEDQPGVCGGGMLKRQHPGHGVTQYVNVEDLEATLKKAVALGATQMMPKTPVPGMGYFALLMDLDKNPFGIWQTDESAS